MTSHSKQKQADVALSDEAIDWLVVLSSGRATQEDHAAFNEWRQTSPAHELAAREAETIWHGLGIVGDEVRHEEKKARQARIPRRAFLGAAGLAMLGIVGERLGMFAAGGFADYSTRVGELRTIALPDGSSVQLNASTALSVDFTEQSRVLSLYEGQATFIVARDHNRPFIVKARGGRTRAVGTVFDIDIQSEAVVVTVVEGTVAVMSDADSEKSVIANADHRVRYSSDFLTKAEAADSSLQTAWQRGKLIFDRKPLGEVVAEIRRYRAGQIIVANDRLRSLSVTGVFDLSDPDMILRTIEETLPVRVTRLPLVTILR